jgi:glycosyltransferase involved in cell wall biosynthesis
MNDIKIFVNAANCHKGGGKTLLNGFIKGLSGVSDKVILYTDERFQSSCIIPETVKIIKVSILNRFLVGFKIRKEAKENDKILYFGNLPPFLKFPTKNVYLLLSSRFYIDKISFKDFKFRDRIKIILEKIYFKIFLSNVSSVIVQTSTMRELFERSGYKKQIYVWAFDDIGVAPTTSNLNMIKEPESFIYVASLLSYKNHKRLLQAWKKLKESGLTPKLYLTLDEDNLIGKWIKTFVTENELNVCFLKNLKREQLIKYYEKTEVLIYPSFFEAYGLPLIEARKFHLNILAADVDYSWDFITPDGFFNPYDVDSITRAVKRYLNKSEKLDQIYTPKEFINKLLTI